MTAFEEFGVLPEIARAVEDMEWNLPTDVQAEAIPLILGGGDVLMAAETGSGKTGAFCLPILQTVWETLRALSDPAAAVRKTGGVAGSGPPAWTMSVHDRSTGLAVTPDGVRCQSRDQREWHGGRSTSGVRASGSAGGGCYHFEATVTDEGLCRIGWATQRACRELGTDAFGFGFGGTGMKSNARAFEAYGEPFGLNDVIGCTLDFGHSEIRFSKNGVDLGRAFALTAAMRREVFYPAVLLKNAEMALNFGAQGFRYPPPTASAVACAMAAADAHIPNPLAGGAASAQPQKPAANAPQAVIIEPSRELCEQTAQQLRRFGVHLQEPRIRQLLLVGGVNVRDQLQQLSEGVDIVVATPGRLDDLIAGGQLQLGACKFFVLDEADALLQAGHAKFIEKLHAQMPKVTADGRPLQMVVCSATLHAMEVRRMAERIMRFPTWIDLKGEDAVPETVHHVVVNVDPLADDSWRLAPRRIRTDGVHAADALGAHIQSAVQLSEAVKWLKGEYLLRAIRVHRIDRALLFCRTKLDCDNVEQWLRDSDAAMTCLCLHSDRAPAERRANLEQFQAGKVRFLICTDVAARGLDIRGLPFTINVTMPDEKANYVHRIGRVGRADRMGLAISLVATVPEKVWYHGKWCGSPGGKRCTNTALASNKGCCIWYNERQLLADVEDHLNITVEQIDATTMAVPVNEFDGRVVYGEKRKGAGIAYETHVGQLVPVVERLAEMERGAQTAFLKRTFRVV